MREGGGTPLLPPLDSSVFMRRRRRGGGAGRFFVFGAPSALLWTSIKFVSAPFLNHSFVGNFYTPTVGIGMVYCAPMTAKDKVQHYNMTNDDNCGSHDILLFDHRPQLLFPGRE